MAIETLSEFDLMWPTLKAFEKIGETGDHGEIVEELKKNPQFAKLEIWEKSKLVRTNLEIIKAVEKNGGKWKITEQGRKYQSAEEILVLFKQEANKRDYYKKETLEKFENGIKNSLSKLDIQPMYEKILQYFLRHKKNNPDFTFHFRKGHGEDSLEKLHKGYWFFGDHNCVSAGLFSRLDCDNKTKTIAFVYNRGGAMIDGKQCHFYIEIVFSNINTKKDESPEAHNKFHEELIKKYNAKQESKKYFIFEPLADGNIEDKLSFYVNEFRDECVKLLNTHNLTDRYIINNADFDEQKKVIDAIDVSAKPNAKNDMSEKEYEEIEKDFKFIQLHKNVIYYGPPGTGKTRRLNQLKQQFADRCKFITFHQNYGYEDFIEGLKPELDSKNVSYHIEDGIFKQICDAAIGDPDNNYAIFIDEINRGNISKIFGELITLIEKSKRLGEDEAMKLKLPYSGDEFGVPNNLLIIGAMNTADRSIARLDTALRRRFKFKEMLPNYDHPLINREVNGIHLGKMLQCINDRIEFLHDRDHVIGHSYLMHCKTIPDLAQVFEHDIIPLMQEYFYADWEKINQIFNKNGFIAPKDKPENLDVDRELYKIHRPALDDKAEYIKIYEPDGAGNDSK